MFMLKQMLMGSKSSIIGKTALRKGEERFPRRGEFRSELQLGLPQKSFRTKRTNVRKSPEPVEFKTWGDKVVYSNLFTGSVSIIDDQGPQEGAPHGQEIMTPGTMILVKLQPEKRAKGQIKLGPGKSRGNLACEQDSLDLVVEKSLEKRKRDNLVFFFNFKMKGSFIVQQRLFQVPSFFFYLKDILYWQSYL